MEIEVIEKKKVNAKYISLSAHVRYWVDSTVNGVEDEEGRLIPFRIGDNWCPYIDIDTGIIKDWPIGTTAEIHYKVVDECSYNVIGEDKAVISSVYNEYVPSFLSPKENGYGDYIIMDIDEEGLIQDWDISPEDIQSVLED